MMNKVHRTSIRNLYRSLIKGTRRIKTVSSNGLEGDELEKFLLDSDQYTRSLIFEMRYHLRLQFTESVQTKEALFEKFYLGQELSQMLEPLDFPQVVSFAVRFREHQFKLQKWRADYIRNESKIKSEIAKHKSGKQIKRDQSKLLNNSTKVEFNSLTWKEKHIVIQKELRKAEEFSSHLLRRYLKTKQRLNELPIPQLLVQSKYAMPIYKSRFTIPNTNKRELMEAAYDMEYIEAVIAPSLEYDINKYHYLDKLDNIVNRKGPYQVKIRSTSAGPIGMPFLKLPYNRSEQLQEVAMDIKRLITCTRIQNVWNSTDQVQEEKMMPDGGYNIAKSHGFGPDETIYPRGYYEKWARSEAQWEHLVSGKPLRKLEKEWTEYLDIATVSVDQEVQKYRNLRNSKTKELEMERTKLQPEMDIHYDKLLRKFNTLVGELQNDKVFKHSELVNRSKCTTTFFDQMTRNGRIGKRERIGLGKTLSDYMSVYQNFQWGYEFYKRFKFRA